MPDPSADPVSVELDVLARWERDDTFQKSLDARLGAPHFVFYEGPPTANGKPGIHHVMARTVKDLFCRYKTMQGFRVDRKAGWDTHGLPVEIEVEKELGLKGRDAVEAYGLAKFNEACRASVLKYKDLWDSLTVRMGYWVDLEHPYVTFETDYMESVWALLKRIHEAKDEHGESLLTRGHRIQWYSPANGTVLSSHEVSLGYKEVQDVSCTVRFPVEGEDNVSLLAWTTTPWTLPANAALAVNPKTTYVKARLGEGDETEYVWIAQALLSKLTTEGETVETRTGAELVGTVYVPPYNVAGDDDEMYGLAEALADEDRPGHVWRVVAADYVTTEDGTGIVHTAPAFGMDDWQTGAKEGLPTLNPINPDGTFKDGFPLVGGMDFKAADRPILRDLKERGLLYREDSYVHNYPHDWRRGTPLMQYPVESWFARTTAVKDRMVELNETVNWQPEGIGTGRFGQWLENNVDWALSRMRFWGTPLPIWVSDQDEDHVEVIGSVEELKARAGEIPAEARNPNTGELDLHRPYVDAITWPDGKGGTMRRIPDLVDVWFDSGAMPWAQWHAPFENEDKFAANVPADLIAEGVDQTRGWFYTLHAIAALVDDRVAYKNVVVNGLVLDAEGKKMSKSVGNTVDPFQAIETHGADAVRWTMMSASPPWESLKYSDDAIVATRRKLFGTLANTYTFYRTYAELDGFAYVRASATATEARTELDRWILSRLQSTVAESTKALDAYHPTRQARAVEAFVDDLSNWYLRRSRRRFWSKGMGEEAEGMGKDPHAPSLMPHASKQAAYETLYECLETVAKLMAPIAPFTSEWLFGELTGERASVHLEEWPVADDARLDADLEGRMALARAVVTATLALRNEASLGVRQPLGALTVVTGSGGVDEAVLRSVEGVILDEVNVKRLETASGGVVTKTAKPNFKALGRRLGKQMKAANAAIRDLTPEQVDAYERDGSVELPIDGGTVTLEAGDLDVVSEGVEGRPVRQESASMPDGSVQTVTVALDTTLTDALRAEGVAREFVNRVQNLRKEAGFDVSDRIAIAFSAPKPRGRRSCRTPPRSRPRRSPRRSAPPRRLRATRSPRTTLARATLCSPSLAHRNGDYAPPHALLGRRTRRVPHAHRGQARQGARRGRDDARPAEGRGRSRLGVLAPHGRRRNGRGRPRGGVPHDRAPADLRRPPRPRPAPHREQDLRRLPRLGPPDLERAPDGRPAHRDVHRGQARRAEAALARLCQWEGATGGHQGALPLFPPHFLLLATAHRPHPLFPMRVLWATFLIVVADQITKVIVKATMIPGESIPVVGRLFRFTFTENPGMAFGLELGGGDAGKLFLSVFSVLATVGILVWISRVREAPVAYRLALALVLGGALGNVIDRVFYGAIWNYAPLGFGNVVDFLHLDVWAGTLPFVGYIALFPIGNIADVSILIGIGMLLLSQKAFQEYIVAQQAVATDLTATDPTAAEPPPITPPAERPV